MEVKFGDYFQRQGRVFSGNSAGRVLTPSRGISVFIIWKKHVCEWNIFMKSLIFHKCTLSNYTILRMKVRKLNNKRKQSPSPLWEIISLAGACLSLDVEMNADCKIICV